MNEMQAAAAEGGLFPFKQHIISSGVFVFKVQIWFSPPLPSLLFRHICVLGVIEMVLSAARMFISKSFGNFEDENSCPLIPETGWQRADAIHHFCSYE